MAKIDANINAMNASNVAQFQQLSNRATASENKIASIEHSSNRRMGAIEHVVTDLGERTARQSEAIIRGIPLRGNENEEKLRSYVATIANFIGFALHPTFVLSVTILDHKPKSGAAGAGAQRRGFPSLLVRFLSEPVRRDFFVKYLQSRDGVRTKLLDFTTDSRIYIVDNLTRLNEEILRKAKTLKMSGHLRRAEVRHGAVMVTDNDGHSKTILSTGELSMFAGTGHQDFRPPQQRLIAAANQQQQHTANYNMQQ